MFKSGHRKPRLGRRVRKSNVAALTEHQRCEAESIIHLLRHWCNYGHILIKKTRLSDQLHSG